MAERTLWTERFLLWVNNDGYPTSLEVRKIYRSLPDPAAAAKGFARVLDESGDDYPYPIDRSVVVELPKAAVDALHSIS